MPAREWTAQEVTAAVNDWLWLPKGGAHQRTAEYLAVLPPDYMGLPVLVRVFGSRRPSGELVDEVMQVAAGWGRTRMSWRVSGETRPADLENELLRRGGVVEAVLDVLALPMVDGVAPIAVPVDVTLREVTDEATLRDVYRVSNDAFGGEQVTEERIATDLEELRSGLPEGPVGRVIAYVDGQPAGTGGWTLAGQMCRLWGGATHTHFRRRGVYRAVLAERLRIGREAGASLGLSLGRANTSGPILRRLGFIRYGEQREILLDANR
jgi:ribosomal protein S18 acetylase RimI-like enzyme